MIGSIDINNIVLLLIALATAFNSYMAYRSRTDIKAIEINTNSMKDALVASTAKASFSEGSETARLAGEVKADQLATQTALIETARLTPTTVG